jgi:hypothetical protein
VPAMALAAAEGGRRARDCVVSNVTASSSAAVWEPDPAAAINPAVDSRNLWVSAKASARADSENETSGGVPESRGRSTIPVPATSSPTTEMRRSRPQAGDRRFSLVCSSTTHHGVMWTGNSVHHVLPKIVRLVVTTTSIGRRRAT